MLTGSPRRSRYLNRTVGVCVSVCVIIEELKEVGMSGRCLLVPRSLYPSTMHTYTDMRLTIRSV